MDNIGPQRATPKSMSAIKAELKQGISVMVTPIRITEDGHYLVDQNGILIAWATKEIAERAYGINLPVL
jgi:hypothetical protein